MGNERLYQGISLILAVFLVILALKFILPEKVIEMPNNKVADPITAVSDEEIAAVLLQRALDENVSVSETDVNRTVQNLIVRANMTEAAFFDFILGKYASEEEFLGKVENNLMIVKLIDGHVNRSAIVVNDTDIDVFIAENADIMPVAQLQNDSVFKEQFYTIARQQVFQNKQNKLVSVYIQQVLDEEQ